MWRIDKNKINEVTIDRIDFNDLLIVMKHKLSKNYYVLLNDSYISNRFNEITIDEQATTPIDTFDLDSDPIYSRKVFFFDDTIELEKGEYDIYILQNIYDDINDLKQDISDIIERCESISMDVWYSEYFEIYCSWMLVK